MGIFKNIGNFVVKTIGNFINSGNEIISNTATWFKENIMGLGKTPSYNYQTSSIEETKKVNQLIEKCVSDYGAQARKYEESAQDILKEYLRKIEESLEPFKKDNIIPDYVFNMLSQESNFLSKSLDNSFYDSIGKVFSLNNSDLLDILRLKPGKEKEEKLEKLAKSTLEETYKSFIEKIEEFLKEQGNLLGSELIKLKEHQEKEGKNVEKSFKEIENNVKNNFDMTKTIRSLEITKKKLERISL